MDLSFTNEHPPVTGCLLISEPFLDDSYFQRSVVLVCNNDDSGAFGFVLNKFLPLNLLDLDESFSNYKGKVSLGGPVDNDNLYFIHRLGEQVPGSLHIKDDLYYGGDFDEISALLVANPHYTSKIRFFVGYSGWGTEQLEEELAKNTWRVVPDYSVDFMMTDFSDDIWKKLMRKQGGKFSILSNSPIDPSNN